MFLKVLRKLALGLSIFLVGLVSGSGLILLNSHLPLSAIEINIQDNSFRFKMDMPELNDLKYINASEPQPKFKNAKVK